MSNTSMFDLTQEYLTLLDMAEDPDVEPEVLKDTLEAVGGEIEVKVENCAKICTILANDEAALDAEIKRLTKRKASVKKNREGIKNLVKEAMIATGKLKFKTLKYTFFIKNNPEKLDITDETKVPQEFWFVPEQAPIIDSDKLKKALQEGEKVPGAQLTQGSHVEFR